MSRRAGTTLVAALAGMSLTVLVMGLVSGVLSSVRRTEKRADRDGVLAAAALAQERLESDLRRIVVEEDAPAVELRPDGIRLKALSGRPGEEELEATAIDYRVVGGALQRVSAGRSQRIGAPHVTGAHFARTTGGKMIRVTLVLGAGAAHVTFAVRIPRPA